MAIYLTMILLPDVWDQRAEAIMPARRIREMLIRPVTAPRGLLRRLATKFTNPTGSKTMPETLGLYHLRQAGSPVLPGTNGPPELSGKLAWVKFRTPDRRWHQTCPVPPVESAFDGLDDKKSPSMTDLINEGFSPTLRPRVSGAAPATARLRLPPGWDMLLKLLDEHPFLWADLLLARELSKIYAPMPVAFVMQQDVHSQFVEQGYWEFREGFQRYSTWSHLGRNVTAYRHSLPDNVASVETIKDGDLTREQIQAMMLAEGNGEGEEEERLEVSYDDWFGPNRGDYARFFHDRGLARFFGAPDAFPMSAMPIGVGADLAAEEVPLASRR